ncbi:MAG: glycosyltransferase family 4 protein [Erysipelotrichaceae bacterium]|nr:glycosyltransferase family 4 protein [Erysipelotrichaceae bacterium]
MNICIITAFDTNEQRADMLKRVFLEAGHSVIVLASDWKHLEKVKRVEAKEGYRLFHAKPYYKNLSIDRIISHVRLSRKIFSYVDKHHDEIDVLWVIFPPNSFVKDAAKIKEKYPQIKLVLDANDFWPETLPAEKARNLWPMAYWRDLRNNHINAADQVVTECRLFENNMKPILSGTPSKTIYLARDTKKPELPSTLPEDRIYLCWLGAINNIIDIPKIQEVIENISRYKPVTMHIIGSGENLDLLVESVQSTGAAVLYHGIVYDQIKKKQIMDQCHYGLNIMKDTVVVGLTMKSLDYFASGLPILNTIKADTWAFTEKEKIGFNVQPSLDYEQVVNYDMSMRQHTANFYMNTFTYPVFKENVLSLPVFEKQ